MTEIQRLLASNIREMRRKLKLTQAELAERADITQNFLGEIENMKKFPRPNVLQSIADALGLKPYQLFMEESSAIEGNNQEAIREMVLEMKDELSQQLDILYRKYSKRIK